MAGRAELLQAAQLVLDSATMPGGAADHYVVPVEEMDRLQTAVARGYRAEGQAVEVRTEAFAFAWGHKPRGYGIWKFKRYGNEEGELFTWRGLYSEGKKKAIQWARERGCNTLEVQPS